MKNQKTDNLELIKYRMGYSINETPRYRSVMKEDDEFDELPSEIDSPRDNETTPVNVNDDTEQENPDQPQSPVEEPTDVELPTSNIEDDVQTEKNVNELQNDIIQHNIQAMKEINDQIKSLDSYVKNINDQIGQLSSKVKEVEEPTDAEKLMSKKHHSFPYYYNLPDVWKGNWFEQKRESENENGIKELPDGTFIADFDDLPKYSETDIQNSFSEIV